MTPEIDHVVENEPQFGLPHSTIFFKPLAMSASAPMTTRTLTSPAKESTMRMHAREALSIAQARIAMFPARVVASAEPVVGPPQKFPPAPKKADPDDEADEADEAAPPSRPRFNDGTRPGEDPDAVYAEAYEKLAEQVPGPMKEKYAAKARECRARIAARAAKAKESPEATKAFALLARNRRPALEVLGLQAVSGGAPAAVERSKEIVERQGGEVSGPALDRQSSESLRRLYLDFANASEVPQERERYLELARKLADRNATRDAGESAPAVALSASQQRVIRKLQSRGRSSVQVLEDAARR
jgi:hypothetical protein